MKTVLYFMAGVAVGSAATFFIARKILSKKYEDEAEQRIQEEVKSVKEIFMKRAAAKEKADKNEEMKIKAKEAVDIQEERPDEKTDDEPEKKIRIKEFDGEDIRKSYSRNVFDEPYTNEELFGDDEDDIDEETPREGMREDPYPISADEFANEQRYFDKITIFLYEDGIATDEQERYVDDLDQLIGVDNLRRIHELMNEDGSVLIRNEMRSTDYEVLIRNETYIPDGMPVKD